MLENIRESSQGLTAKIILGLVILTFALAGVGSYSNSTDTSVADVNGEKITQQDFNKAYQTQRNNLQQQFGEMFDNLAADKTYMANFRNSVVDNLINQRLVDQNAYNLALRVSDKRIKETILNMPEFQIDGVFDNSRYLALLNQAGFYQPSDFSDYLRLEMNRRQLTQSLVLSDFVLPYQKTMIAKLENQKRNIRYASVALEQFKGDVEVAEDEIKRFYQENSMRFMNEEQVKVNYITLSADDIAKNITVSDEEINTYYLENIKNYQTDEQRKISHILIEFESDELNAKEQAESILAKVKAGESFSELAKEFSNDTFSAENGGDLDWLERGSMDEVFDEQAFNLAKIGDVSDVVKTEYGFHIIKVTDIKPQETKTLKDAYAELTSSISKQKAQEEFFILQQEMARISYEFPDSLDDAAESIGTEVLVSPWISKNGGTGVFENRKVIETVFSDLILNEQLNSDVIEISDTLAVVVRLNEHQKANVKPLTEVAGNIKAMLISEKAKTKAETEVTALLQQLSAGEDITEKLSALSNGFETKSDVTRKSVDIERLLIEKAFTLPHPIEGSISAGIANLNNGDFAIVEVESVIEEEGQIDDKSEQQHVNQLSQSAYLSYVALLKAKASITKNTAVTQIN